jgi:hypothetical protein
MVSVKPEWDLFEFAGSAYTTFRAAMPSPHTGIVAMVAGVGNDWGE